MSTPILKFKGGGSFINKQPKFSADGQSLFVAWNNVLISYNIKTGKRLREYRGLWDAIADFEVTHIDGIEYVIACSTTAEVMSWKTDLGFRMLKIEVPIPNHCFVHTFNFLHNNKFLISYSGNDGCATFAIFSISSRKLERVDVKIKKGFFKVAVSRSGYFAIAQDSEFFFVRLCNVTKIHKRRIQRDKAITCIACHPEEECIVTGDSLGRVSLWYNLESPVHPGIYHWHTLPVNCVGFSASGGNFFSGGNENVLVKWYLDDPHRKNFVPRMTASLEHITVSSDNMYVAIATTDNAVHVFDAQFEEVSVIQHLVLGSSFTAGILYDGRSKSMVLNGLTGHVQFYSPHDMMLLYNLDIVAQNKLTQERKSYIENTAITKIAIDDHGLWLATVEERKPGTLTAEIRLKFWSFNTTKQQFEANTHIELPHEKSVVNVLFQPHTKEPRCVTLGEDARFKIWQCVNADTIYNKGNAWKCLYTGTYRDLPCTTQAFSCDGSLLGIGFGPIITTWEPDTCKIKCSLVHPTHRNSLTAMHFGIANQCHLVVAASCDRLSVWNLLTLAMVWTVPLNVTHLVASAFFPCMAVFTTSMKVYVFSPDSSQPLFEYEFVPQMGQIVAAGFIPAASSSDSKTNWFKSTLLFFINSKEEMFCFDTEEDNIDSFDFLTEDLNSGLFNTIVPKKKSSSKKIKPLHHLSRLSSNNKEIRELLNAPIHTMMPQHVICDNLLRSIVLEHTVVK